MIKEICSWLNSETQWGTEDGKAILQEKVGEALQQWRKISKWEKLKLLIIEDYRHQKELHKSTNRS